MSDDSQKVVSVQIPSDILKEIASVTETAKPSTDGTTLVTMRFSPETVTSLIRLRENMTAFEESQVASSQTIVDRLIKTSEMRTSFYEKLILLAGGSFALSLTFLTSLHRATLQSRPLAAMGRLEAAWILLLTCIVFSWLHNLNRYAGVDHVTLANATFVTAMQENWAFNLLSRAAALFRTAESPSVGFSDGVTMVAHSFRLLSQKSKESGTQSVKDFRLHYNVSAVLGGLALLSIVVAFALMIVFAIKNAGLL
jgi:hypothetical protein